MNHPKPLLRDAALGDELRAILEAGSAHEPTPADLAALGKRLAAALPPGTLPPPSGTGGPPLATQSTTALASSATGKIALGVIAAGVIAGGAWFARSDRAVVPNPPAASVRAAPTPPPVTAPTISPSAEAPVLSPADLPSAPPPSPSARVAPNAPPEATLLARAHEQLLHGDGEAALVTTSEHARAYPRGSLSQEREVIAIEALVALGRNDDAKERAAAFHRAYPGSSHAGRVDRLVGP
jgi:hypothetical protein